MGRVGLSIIPRVLVPSQVEVGGPCSMELTSSSKAHHIDWCWLESHPGPRDTFLVHSGSYESV